MPRRGHHVQWRVPIHTSRGPCELQSVRTVDAGCGRVAARAARRVDRPADHRSGLRVAGEASRHRDDDAAEAQQVVEQRLVPDLSERAVRRAVSRNVPRARAQHALLPAVRRRNDVRRQADGRGGGLQVLEAAGVGQVHDRDGLSLPRPLRVHPVLREGQAAAQRSRDCRRDQRAARARRVSGGEAVRKSRRS